MPYSETLYYPDQSDYEGEGFKTLAEARVAEIRHAIGKMSILDFLEVGNRGDIRLMMTEIDHMIIPRLGVVRCDSREIEVLGKTSE